MKHSADVIEHPAVERVTQPLGLDVIVKPERNQVAPFLRTVEDVGDQDALVPASFSAQTRALPMKPAPPVTRIVPLSSMKEPA